MGRPFRHCDSAGSERRHDRPSVVRRRARTGQSPDPRAADICPVGPRAAALPSAAPRSSPGVVRSLGRFLPVQVAWIAEGLLPWSEHRVGSLVPCGFEAYARVFHPAVRYPDDELFGIDSDDPDEDVTWAEVAAFNGRTAHPAMEWASITGSWEFQGNDDQPGLWNDAPAEGHLPVSVARDLTAVLARFTTTPGDCWFGLEQGVGSGPTEAPRLALPPREYVLQPGPLDLAAANLADEPAEQSANLWWPDDRAWFVATDIDLMTTYVGGSAACIADLLAADGVEAAQVPADQRTTWDADTVNPAPLGAPS